MRDFLAMVLAVLLIGGVAGMASAANHGAAPVKKAAKPPAEKAAKLAAEKTRRHVGTVKAVDAAGKTLTVEEKSGEATVAVTEKTIIKRGKDTVKLEDLRAGDQVTVVYSEQDGKQMARSILVKAQ